jgi:tripartite-type tricarboxylate transporter receptor subunit TctC
MKLPRRQFLHLVAGTAALPAVSRIAAAQAYPSRPITLVVPSPPGGASDVIGRVLAPRMGTSLGRAIVLENIAGANGSLGVGRVARALPDGYTLVIGYWGTHVANGAIYALKYDVLNDFEPISLLATQPFLIVAKKALPADDLKGLVAWLKANPGKASAGTAGVGVTDHVGGALFQAVTGTRFQFVPYRGAGPAVQDLVGGQMDIMFESPTITLPQVRSGQLKAFAVAGESRLAGAPEIPTVDEAGLPGFYVTFWAGLWAPKGTPRDIIAKLNSAAVTALGDPTVRTRFTDLGLEIYPATSRRLRRLPPFRRPKSRNGGQSSRDSGSGRSEPAAASTVNGGDGKTSPPSLSYAARLRLDLAERFELLRRAAGMLAAPAADMDAEFACDGGKAALERADDARGDARGMPVHSHHRAERLEPERPASSLSDRLTHVEPLARELEAPIVMPLDVRTPGQMEAVFERITSGTSSILSFTRSLFPRRKRYRGASSTCPGTDFSPPWTCPAGPSSAWRISRSR